MRRGLILALVSTAVLLTCADGKLSAQNEASMTRHKLDIGKAVRVEIPSTWLPEPFKPAANRSRVCRFTKQPRTRSGKQSTFGQTQWTM